MKRKLCLLLCAAMTAAALAGCGGSGSAENDGQNTSQAAGSESQTSEGNVLIYAMDQEPETIDPTMNNYSRSSNVLQNLFSGLFRMEADGSLTNALCEEYKVSDDNLTYTFTLKEGMKWSDGSDLTANDFVYSWLRVLNPETASPASWELYYIQGAEEYNTGGGSVEDVAVKAVDDKTLEVTLKSPTAYFLYLLAGTNFFPVKQDVVEGEEVWTKSADTYICNGPFMMAEINPQESYVLVKNPNYYDADSIKLDGVEVLKVADGTTAVSMFNAGDLDLAEVPSDLAPQYEGQTLSYYDGSNDYAALNHNNEYLANKNFRLALNYAINREEYNLLSHNGLYAENLRYVLPQVRGVEGEYGTEYPLEFFPLQGDMDKAQEYLTVAMEELGVSDPSEISLKLVVSDSDASKKEAEVVVNQWKNNLGIDVQINMVPYATRNAMLVPNSTEFDIIMTGWVPDYSDPYSYLELWYSTSGYNYLNYKSEAYDSYLDASKTTTGKERMDNLFNAEKVLLEDGALVPLQLREVQYMVSDRVENLGAYFIGLNYDYMYADIVA